MDIQTLETQFYQDANSVGLSLEHQQKALALLRPLRDGPEGVRAHYAHSLRVGHLAKHIALTTFHDERALLLAGTLHDIGKSHVHASILAKTTDWTVEDAVAMEAHVMAGYELLRDIFDFSAEVMVWHHKFQKNGYPKKLPPLLHDYSMSTQLLIIEHGRMLALADVYDALHRSNDKFGGALSKTRIRELMFTLNPDREALITHLYETGVFEQ